MKSLTEVFKNPQNFNWAWQFYAQDDEQWIQFDCVDCIQLEFNFQAYRISGKDSFKIIEIIRGTINFDTCEMIQKKTGMVTKIMRTPTNARRRPNAHKRHDPSCNDDVRDSFFKFQYRENLEYLSLNYRKQKVAKIC